MSHRLLPSVLAAVMLAAAGCQQLPRLLTTERPLDFTRFLDACRQAQDRAASDALRAARERDFSLLAESEKRRWDGLLRRPASYVKPSGFPYGCY